MTTIDSFVTSIEESLFQRIYELRIHIDDKDVKEVSKLFYSLETEFIIKAIRDLTDSDIQALLGEYGFENALSIYLKENELVASKGRNTAKILCCLIENEWITPCVFDDYCEWKKKNNY